MERKCQIRDKVNKEEGCTFQPKLNDTKNRKMVDPNSNVVDRNKEFLVRKAEKILKMKNQINKRNEQQLSNYLRKLFFNLLLSQ